MIKIPLNFHFERTQPLSDLCGKRDAHIYLVSETPIEINVSIMTSRGLTHFDRIKTGIEPYILPYTPPACRDWSVLQIQAINRIPPNETPYTIDLIIN